MLCVRCKKRIAVVFMSRYESGKLINEGLCLTCAKELGIHQVDDVIAQMGMTEEDIKSMEDMNGEIMENLDEETFSPGGAKTFPFLKNFFGQSEDTASSSGAAAEGAKSSAQPEKMKEKDTGKKFLDNYCQNLTESAKNGKLDRIIGRDKEIYRVVQILSRRTKNNPCLIGEPGVGKTAIAEGIAQRIITGDVPLRLADKEVYLLDLTALVAGTQFRGQFESRIKGLISEVKAAGNVILFIDEVHNLVGAGDSEGSMSAANILKPALSRGEIQVIGATTFNEYRKHIEKDAALERRFQPVTVREPSVEETIEVLLGVKNYYEKYHRIQVPADIIRNAVVLSERYITDRFLPDKAIDLLDESCAHAALRSKELADFDKLVLRQKSLQVKLDEKESAVPEEQDFEKIAGLKADLFKIEKEQEKLLGKLENLSVTTDDLAKVIELWTGIPATKIKETEFKKIGNLEEALKAKIIGQDAAVEAVCRAIKRNRANISPRRRPASFIMVGPTGVGKTELVRQLSIELFDDVEPLIRLDMSEFMEKHSVSRIVGSPPGYVGYDDAGQLTEKVRRKPYSVILFDEIEKAHPDVMNILLQILDDGKLTDAHGRTVNFENTIIVMTSNAGSTSKEVGVGFSRNAHEISAERAMKALSDFLRPEFLGRVDEIVVFNPLTEDDYRRIAALILEDHRVPLLEKGIALKYDEEATRYIARSAFGKKGGARDLHRVIVKEVEDKIAELIIDRGEGSISEVRIAGKEDGLEILAK